CPRKCIKRGWESRHAWNALLLSARLHLAVDRIGMVHVHDSPFAVRLLAKSRAPRREDLIAERNSQVVFHPHGVADGMMRARNDDQLGRRLVAKVALAIVGQDSFAAVEVSAGRKDDYFRIETIGQSGLIGPVECCAAGAPLSLEVGKAVRQSFRVQAQAWRRPLELNAGPKSVQKINSQDAVNLPAAGAAKG